MTQRNNFDVRQIRPTIQFIQQQDDTTESRLEDIREQMAFTRAKNTIRKTGWYFTEPYAPCGSVIASPPSRQAESGLVDEVGA